MRHAPKPLAEDLSGQKRAERQAAEEGRERDGVRRARAAEVQREVAADDDLVGQARSAGDKQQGYDEAQRGGRG